MLKIGKIQVWHRFYFYFLYIWNISNSGKKKFELIGLIFVISSWSEIRNYGELIILIYNIFKVIIL